MSSSPLSKQAENFVQKINGNSLEHEHACKYCSGAIWRDRWHGSCIHNPHEFRLERLAYSSVCTALNAALRNFASKAVAIYDSDQCPICICSFDAKCRKFAMQCGHLYCGDCVKTIAKCAICENN